MHPLDQRVKEGSLADPKHRGGGERARHWIDRYRYASSQSYRRNVNVIVIKTRNSQLNNEREHRDILVALHTVAQNWPRLPSSLHRHDNTKKHKELLSITNTKISTNEKTHLFTPWCSWDWTLAPPGSEEQSRYMYEQHNTAGFR